jgi:hypothetical protein
MAQIIYFVGADRSETPRISPIPRAQGGVQIPQKLFPHERAMRCFENMLNARPALGYMGNKIRGGLT